MKMPVKVIKDDVLHIRISKVKKESLVKKLGETSISLFLMDHINKLLGLK